MQESGTQDIFHSALSNMDTKYPIHIMGDCRVKNTKE